MWLRGGRGRSMRRAFPIAGYVGPNGSGKTAADGSRRGETKGEL